MTRLSALAAMFLAAGSVEAAEQSPWKSLAPFPAPIREAALIGCDGKIYMFTGQGIGYLPLGLVYQYDPANDAWKPLKPMPSARGGASAAAMNGKVYVMGGAGVHPGMKNTPLVIGPDGTPNRSLDSVEEYDVASGSWRTPTTLPTPRNDFALAAVNGKLYAIGGRMGSAFALFGSDTEVVEEYNPADNTWGSERAKMSTPRASMSWGVFNGRITVVGGELTDARVTATFRTAEAYEPAVNQWSVLPTVPLDRMPQTGAFIGDTFYLISVYNGHRLLSGERKDSEGSPFDALRVSIWK